MKKLFILSIVMALMLGCATLQPRSNPDGEITTLAYDSEIDPNIFIDFRMVAPPEPVGMKDGRNGLLFRLANPDPNGIPSAAIIIIGDGGILLAYIYELDGKVFAYVLNPEKNRYILFVPKENKNHGF